MSNSNVRVTIPLEIIWKHAREEKLSTQEQYLFDLWLNEDTRRKEEIERFHDSKWVIEQLRKIETISTDRIWKRIQKELRGAATSKTG